MAKAKKKAAKKPAAKKPVKKAAPKKSAAKKAAPKKAAPKKTVPKKTAPKTTATKAAPAKATPAKNAAPKKPAADFANFVTPLDDRVLVRISGTERVTAGGLYIPDTVADVSGNLQGHVVAIGRGHRDKKGRVRPMDVRLGDRVVFAQYAGSKIRLLGEDLVLLRESEVMGIIS